MARDFLFLIVYRLFKLTNFHNFFSIQDRFKIRRKRFVQKFVSSVDPYFRIKVCNLIDSMSEEIFTKL